VFRRIVAVIAFLAAAVALWCLLDLEFERRADITGAATLLLAVATAYLALTTRAEARATMDESRATRDLATLTSTQVERAHRPVLVPLNNGNLLIEGTAYFALPQDSGHHLVIPVENVGMGPALRVRATARFAAENHDLTTATPFPGLGIRKQAALLLSATERVPPGRPFSFEGVLRYEDVAGQLYETRLNWVLTEYVNVEIRTR
jgi:hypothetical protein